MTKLKPVFLGKVLH